MSGPGMGGRITLRRRRRLVLAAGAALVLVAVLAAPEVVAKERSHSVAARLVQVHKRVHRVRRPAPEPTPSQAALDRFAALGLPLYCGGRHGRYVALTFDDGPGPSTALALRILHRHHARATFFVVGSNIARFPSWLTRAEAAAGAVGDHTWNHADLAALPRARVVSEIATTRAALSKSSGTKVEMFRPPYGAHDPAVDAVARSLGLLEVLWSVDTRDSEGAPWKQIAANAEAGARPGAIILMHENRGQALRALADRLLPWLKRHHYRTVSVPELLALDPPTVAQLRQGLRGCYG